jgi:hypothetical protein
MITNTKNGQAPSYVFFCGRTQKLEKKASEPGMELAYVGINFNSDGSQDTKEYFRIGKGYLKNKKEKINIFRDLDKKHIEYNLLKKHYLTKKEKGFYFSFGFDERTEFDEKDTITKYLEKELQKADNKKSKFESVALEHTKKKIVKISSVCFDNKNKITRLVFELKDPYNKKNKLLINKVLKIADVDEKKQKKISKMIKNRFIFLKEYGFEDNYRYGYNLKFYFHTKEKSNDEKKIILFVKNIFFIVKKKVMLDIKKKYNTKHFYLAGVGIDFNSDNEYEIKFYYQNKEYRKKSQKTKVVSS